MWEVLFSSFFPVFIKCVCVCVFGEDERILSRLHTQCGAQLDLTTRRSPPEPKSRVRHLTNRALWAGALFSF